MRIGQGREARATRAPAIGKMLIPEKRAEEGFIAGIVAALRSRHNPFIATYFSAYDVGRDIIAELDKKEEEEKWYE